MAFDDELREALHMRAEHVQVSADARSRLADVAVRAETRRRRRVASGVAAAAVVAVAVGTVGVLQLREDRNQLVTDGGQAAAPSGALALGEVPRFILDVPDGWVLSSVNDADRGAGDQGGYQVFRRDPELATIADPTAPAVSIRTFPDGGDTLPEEGGRTVRVRGTEGVAAPEELPGGPPVQLRWSEGGVGVLATATNVSEEELVGWLDAGTLVDGVFQPGDAEPSLVETVNRPMWDALPRYALSYFGPEDLTQPTDPRLNFTAWAGIAGLAEVAPLGADIEIADVGGQPALVWSFPGVEQPRLTVQWVRDGMMLMLDAEGVDREAALGLAAQVRKVDEAEWEQFIATAEQPMMNAPGAGEIVAGPEPLATGTTPDVEWRMERTVYADGTECRAVAIGGHDVGESCAAEPGSPPFGEGSEPFVIGGHGEAGGLGYLTTNVAGDVTQVVAELDDGTTVEVAPAAGTDGRLYIVLQYPGDRVVERLVAYRADGSKAASVDRPFGGPNVTFDPELRGTPIASGEVDGAPWSVEATRAPTNTGELVDCVRVEFAGQPQPWCPAAMEPDAGDAGAQSVAVRNRNFLVAWSPDAATVRVTYDGGEILSADFGRAPDATLGFAAVSVDFDDGTPVAIELLAADGQVLDAIDPATVGGFDAPPPVPDPGLVDPEAESHG